MKNLETTYLIVFIAGYGDDARLLKLGSAFAQAIKEAFGKQGAGLATSAFLDTQVWAVSVDADPHAVYGALAKRLGKPFDFKAGNPDRIIVAELGEHGLLTSDATVRAAFNLR